MTSARACKILAELGDVYKDYEVIGIDEGQFFKDVNFNLLTKSNCRLSNGLKTLQTKARSLSFQPLMVPSRGRDLTQ